MVAEWGAAPSAEAVRARDDARILEHPALAEAPDDEAELAAALLGEFGPERVAAAFIRLWRGQRSAPEELAEPVAAGAPAERRPRGDFGESVWFSVSIGRSQRAEPRWLLPKICEAGGITREAIGAIRIGEEESFVQIARAQAGGLGDGMELDRGVVLRRIEGEPVLEHRPRPPFRRDERRPEFDPARATEPERPAPAKPYGKPAVRRRLRHRARPRRRTRAPERRVPASRVPGVRRNTAASRARHAGPEAERRPPGQAQSKGSG